MKANALACCEIEGNTTTKTKKPWRADKSLIEFLGRYRTFRYVAFASEITVRIACNACGGHITAWAT